MKARASKARTRKAKDNLEKIRKEFETCTYPNSGAYSPIPTMRGRLENDGDRQ